MRHLFSPSLPSNHSSGARTVPHPQRQAMEGDDESPRQRRRRDIFVATTGQMTKLRRSGIQARCRSYGALENCLSCSTEMPRLRRCCWRSRKRHLRNQRRRIIPTGAEYGCRTVRSPPALVEVTGEEVPRRFLPVFVGKWYEWSRPYRAEGFSAPLSWGCALRAPPQAVTSPAFSLEHRRGAETYSTENSEEPDYKWASRWGLLRCDRPPAFSGRKRGACSGLDSAPERRGPVAARQAPPLRLWERFTQLRLTRIVPE